MTADYRIMFLEFFNYESLYSSFGGYFTKSRGEKSMGENLG